MSNICVAAVQMEARSASTAGRLARAGRLIDEAAEDSAQLVVLPELFNTGYAYSDDNHHRAEPFDGPTVAWMRDRAAARGVHLAGSLMLLENGDIYNALLLFAPDGRTWRYDKHYPWGWERGYFRPARRRPNVTVAETELGNFGLLVCWDVAHPRLWRQYAGRVDMMLICSCPPDVSNPAYHMPNGDQVTFDDIGGMMASFKGQGDRVFGRMIDQQTAWLGVPAVNTVGCGCITTGVPQGRLALMGALPSAPWLIKYFFQADRMQLLCDMVHQCRLIDGDGRVLGKLTAEDGEAFTLAQVSLPDPRPAPRTPQPPSLIPRSSYAFSDKLLPAFTLPVYWRGVRRIRRQDKRASRLNSGNHV